MGTNKHSEAASNDPILETKARETDAGGPGARINRRGYLAALSGGASAGLAGCLGGDDDGGGDSDDAGGGEDGDTTERGERVSTVTLAWFEGGSGVEGIPELKRALEEDIGVEVETRAVEFVTAYEEMYNDARSWDYFIDFNPSTPQALDPTQLFANTLICDAGANGRGNTTQYANCEFSRLAEQQLAVSDDERLSLVQEANQIFSEDVGQINLFPMVGRGAYRADRVEVLDIGAVGVNNTNPDAWWETRPTGDAESRVVAVGDQNIQTPQYMTLINTNLWRTTVYFPLNYWNGDLELTPGLATDWEIGDELRTFTFFLRENATFHNGEPVTAEDVKWTFEFVADNHAQFFAANPISYDSIEVIDDHTVEFNFAEPRSNFHTLNVPSWGIVPKDIWVESGAEENPTEFEPDPIVGSGPYRVADFERQNVLFMEPYEDHWIDLPDGELIFNAFDDPQAAFRAFQEGTVDIIQGEHGTLEIISAVEDEVPEAEIHENPGWTVHMVSPQFTVAPAMFREFNLAVSHAIDRNRMNTLMEGGGGEPHLYSSTMGETHPFYPDDHEGLTQIAASPDGDPERAREILEDAGYTWDDRGRLHYPPDKDLEPPWPEESEPVEHPDEYPCVEDLCG